MAVAYQVPEGFTLTTLLDFKSHRLVAFASNASKLFGQHGTFSEA